MKLGSNILMTLLVMLCTATLAGCAANSGGDNGSGGPPVGPKPIYKNFVVLVNSVNGHIVTPGQGANAAGRGNGYVGFGVNQAGWTTFMIINESPFASCSGSSRGNQKAADWVITRIEVSDSGSMVTDSRAGGPKLKGDDFGTSVPEWVWISFSDVDPNTGLLFEADKSVAPTFVNVYNANAHSNEELGEKLIYYRIQLTSCADGSSKFADPAWGNDGKK